VNPIDEGAPREVWAYLVDCEGTPVTEEQHVVLVPGQTGTVEAALQRTFESIEGMEDRQPVAIAFRFADGHVATGEIPEGAIEHVQWEEEEDDEEGQP
jgi:hypothetical protein